MIWPLIGIFVGILAVTLGGYVGVFYLLKRVIALTWLEYFEITGLFIVFLVSFFYLKKLLRR
jgi:hypothetical protein